MRHNRDFARVIAIFCFLLSALGIPSRLFHRLLDVQPLNCLDLEMNPLELVANDIRGIRRPGELLPAPRSVPVGAEFVPPLPFTALALLPGVQSSCPSVRWLLWALWRLKSGMYSPSVFRSAACIRVVRLA